jgi:triosephosphate isomerase
MSTHKKTMIAGNWKMHLTVAQASLLVQRLHERVQTHKDIEVVLAPTMLQLQPLSVQLDRRKFRLAAQNAYYKDEGAYTGEVSFTMLRNLVTYALIGHSERRHIFNESLDEVTQKVAAAYRNGIVPILCVGETKIEKLSKETNQVLHDQVVSALANVTSEEVKNIVIAYEPVWAIGTGDSAKPHDVAAAARVIKHNIAELYGTQAAESVRILYGGSVSADTASGYLRLPEVDGLLVGGASLNYHSFSDIIDSAYRAKRNIQTIRDI